MGLVEKSKDNVKQQCLNNVFTLLHCVENTIYKFLNVLKAIFSLLDYFQTYLNPNLIYYTECCTSTTHIFSIKLVCETCQCIKND